MIKRAYDQCEKLAGETRDRMILRIALLETLIFLRRREWQDARDASRLAESAAVALEDFEARQEAIFGASVCLSGEDDGVVQHASQYACGGSAHPYGITAENGAGEHG